MTATILIFPSAAKTESVTGDAATARVAGAMRNISEALHEQLNSIHRFQHEVGRLRRANQRLEKSAKSFRANIAKIQARALQKNAERSAATAEQRDIVLGS